MDDDLMHLLWSLALFLVLEVCVIACIDCALAYVSADDLFECSDCGAYTKTEVSLFESDGTPVYELSYCPNCGARVIEGGSDDK